MPKRPIIQVDNLSVSLEGTEILKNISFDVQEGEYIGIVGPNGGGKTTLLHTLLGLIQPTAGSIKLHGCKTGTHDPTCCIGYVPQHLLSEPFNLPFTVEELIRTGLPDERSDNAGKRIKEILNKVGIENLFKRNIQNLSGGERQKVFLARALVMSPQILILDEPLSALDEPSQRDVGKLLAEINKEGTTIMMVSHDLNLIFENVTKVLCINKVLHHACHPLELEEEHLKEIFKNKQFVHHHTHA